MVQSTTERKSITELYSENGLAHMFNDQNSDKHDWRKYVIEVVAELKKTGSVPIEKGTLQTK